MKTAGISEAVLLAKLEYLNPAGSVKDRVAKAMIEEDNHGGVRRKKADKLPKPIEIKAELDDYVIEQDPAKRSLAVAVYNHYKRINNPRLAGDDVELQKSNILLLGPMLEEKYGSRAIIEVILLTGLVLGDLLR